MFIADGFEAQSLGDLSNQLAHACLDGFIHDVWTDYIVEQDPDGNEKDIPDKDFNKCINDANLTFEQEQEEYDER